eukprot:GHVL01030631.1.p1 GENE.GHVL01030631.1~~GHVL01030631.1.p1  ORF type:complete len:333 (-),score=13.27 GHVL01030631.1:71-1069(-)
MWTSIARCLPVLFTLMVITTLYLIFVLFHCTALLQLGTPPDRRDAKSYIRGIVELVVFHVLFVLLMYNYAMCVFVNPGCIPETEDWQYSETAKPRSPIHLPLNETKNTGERRHCKWCCKYKPDRAHHCRVCRRCVLKMDHHCPWVHNCIGYYNYKYFFLLLFYTFITCHYISWAMFETVSDSVSDEASFGTMFTLLWGETLAMFLSVLITGFFAFHIWLLFKGMTTIEFCEKAARRVMAGNDLTPHDKGIMNNVKEELGKNPLFWCLPIKAANGDGVTWVTEGTPLVSPARTNIRSPKVNRDSCSSSQNETTAGCSTDLGYSETNVVLSNSN